MKNIAQRLPVAFGLLGLPGRKTSQTTASEHRRSFARRHLRGTFAALFAFSVLGAAGSPVAAASYGSCYNSSVVVTHKDVLDSGSVASYNFRVNWCTNGSAITWDSVRTSNGTTYSPYSLTYEYKGDTVSSLHYTDGSIKSTSNAVFKFCVSTGPFGEVCSSWWNPTVSIHVYPSGKIVSTYPNGGTVHGGAITVSAVRES